MGTDQDDRWGVNRRGFLAFSAGMVAAVSLGGLSSAGVGHAAEVKFPAGTCGGGKMQKKVLIVYASKYGSTGGVADAIAKELCSRDVSADVALVLNPGNIGSYQGVIIGSAIYMGKWMPEAVNFVKENKDFLRHVPVAYFLAGISLVDPREEARTKALAFVDPVLKAVPEVKPVSIGTFAGALHYDNLSWINKKILKAKGAPEGDFRNWDAIRAWTRDPVYTRMARAEQAQSQVR